MSNSKKKQAKEPSTVQRLIGKEPMEQQSLIHIIIGIFITIIVSSIIIISLVESSVGGESQVSYENQIAACEAGNPVREAVLLAIRTAQEHAVAGNAAYAVAAQKIIDTPFTNEKTGARNCKEVVRHP